MSIDSGGSHIQAHRKAQARLRSLLDEVLSRSRDVRFAEHIEQHLVAVALHGTILEYGAGILELLKACSTTSAFVILRSALEALADLSAAAADPNYHRFMQLEFLSQNRRVLRGAFTDTTENPFLKLLREHPDSAAKVAEVDAKIAALEADGITQLSVRERFDRGGQLELYAGPYALLCRHSHNNLGILDRRHAEESVIESKRTTSKNPLTTMLS